MYPWVTNNLKLCTRQGYIRGLGIIHFSAETYRAQWMNTTKILFYVILDKEKLRNALTQLVGVVGVKF